ncbi:MAG: hypothetical protein H6732_10850 [Alphaproteobacteria bacterium]|nr:hypothetical protein [Alphaproteobacteria bacterium]
MRLVLPLLLLGCGGTEEAAPGLEAQAAAKCPRVHLDRLPGDWVVATGDPERRFRVVQEGTETLLWFVDPGFSNHKLELVGTRRDTDWRFDERPRGARAELVASGGEAPKRVYVAPRLQKCSVEVYAGVALPDGKEAIPTKPVEYLQFPDQPGLVLTYRPADEPLFLDAAAGRRAEAQRQLAEQGAPTFAAAADTVEVAAWTQATADGDAACAYTADAYVDGRPVEAAQGVAATVVGEDRRWAVSLEGLGSGNHTFELYRYRACEGAGRELLAVAALGAVVP